MATRRVPARDASCNPKPWELTKAQWTLYYWLLAHSKWNSFAREGHYFIYRNSFKNTKIMKDTGIKSQQTISTAFKKLKEQGIIVEDVFHDGAYQIQTTEVFAPIDVSILKFLLHFNQYIDPATSITILAILARWFEFNNRQPIHFTRTQLRGLLGKTKHHLDDAGIVLCLALLSQYGIIALSQKTFINNYKKTCIEYTISNVFLDGGAVINSMFDDEGEVDQKTIDRLWEEIKTVTWVVNNFEEG